MQVTDLLTYSAQLYILVKKNLHHYHHYHDVIEHIHRYLYETLQHHAREILIGS